MVSFDKDSKPTIFTLGKLKRELQKITGKKIDLVEENSFKKEIIKSIQKDLTPIF